MRHAGSATRSVVLSNRTLAAALGGFAGGLAFGILMQFTDIVLMVAALVGRDSAQVGWVVHMSIAVLFGLLYVLLLRNFAYSVGSGVVAGILYGWAWWILGGLIIMPAWLGRPELIFQFTATAWQSLAGHMIYGFLLGLVCPVAYERLDWRARHRPAEQHRAASPVQSSSATGRRSSGAAGVLAASRGITTARAEASSDGRHAKPKAQG